MPPDKIALLLPHRSINAIKLRGNKLGMSMYSESKFHNKWTEKELDFLNANWTYMSDYLMSQKINRSPRAIKAKRNELGLYRQEYNRDLTYDDLSKYLRGNTYIWKQKSIDACNGKCVLTGSTNYAIHHLYNFQYILEEYSKIYNINILKDINDYSSDELEYIVSTFNDFHNTFPLGVCIDKKLHVLFHHYYGKKFNTPEQWYEFQENYKKGKYNH